ncbi:solute carrier family 12 member 9-like [Amphiura filiformis]|uniref:solute carrier family 12 member 9-like n=1 Tax=Amphiura filiformis TaxID=82378 RepID=UPI003B21EFAF
MAEIPKGMQQPMVHPGHGSAVQHQDHRPDDKSPLLRYRLDRSLSRPDIILGGGGNNGSSRNLSTFFGVFVPCVLSMFSVILFLRVGFAIGHAGELETLGMFLLAYFIVLLTVLSISAISTNGAIEGGGAYFMISRALGPEFGGSIGVMFYIANVFSCALYCIGLTEAIEDNFGPSGALINDHVPPLPSGQWWTLLYSSCVLLFCLGVCMIGAKMFARTSFIIFCIVNISLFSVFLSFFIQGPMDIKIRAENKENDTKANYTGFKAETFEENLESRYDVPDYTTGVKLSFAAVFAIIFNGCTGIMAGANMSGELKNPSRAIPLGTMAACIFTGIIYAVLSVLISYTCSKDLLLYDYGFLQDINVVPPLVAVGVLAATLSASLSTLIGASRVLIALARDQLFGILLYPVEWGVTRSGNPWVAVLISWFLVQCVLLLGQLNTIAPLVTIFFLLSYAATNLACMALDIASAPNFRPSFHFFSWHSALLGILGCLTMMFLTNAIFASISLVVFLALFIYIYLRVPESEWGYVTQALIFHQVRKYLLKLDTRKDHVKFWRPQMLLLISNPRSGCQLIRFVNDMKKSGLFVLGHVKTGTLDEFPTDPVQEEIPAWLKLVDTLHVKAFTELTLATTVREGVQHLMRLAGLGGMKPNTVVLGFYDDDPPEDTFIKCGVNRPQSPTDDEDVDIFNQFPPLREPGYDKLVSPIEYVKIMTDCIRLQKNICLTRYFYELDRDKITRNGEPSYIDVWPVNFFKPETVGYLDTACIFLLQVACVLHMVPAWKKQTKLRVFLCSELDEVANTNRKEKLGRFLKELRIKAEIISVPWQNVITLNTQNMVESGIDEDLPTSPTSLITNVSENYIHALNRLVKSYTQKTAVLFCYLPLPSADEREHEQYLQLLDMLTAAFPPTVLVHGIQEVTTLAL